ncbi:GyrI-like domain-containing protein [Candidatus Enterococcus mansonii]|uniref:AraC effector-binding domain-containing protein n=1 Tax=Candidatus Enterococcus mansonii TaxID=1834181 RepID=A0A242CHH3_9ENTE|nr:GyrI-like domain-containing protein [Enterococcus sp. 4G2_DIV0659]OTO09693.1 hypothetical protein A5880_000373 [Enterococcus sp. 4G2_DIV0659]
MNIEMIPSQRIFYLRRIGCYGEQNRQLMETLKEKLIDANSYSEGTTIYGIAWSDQNTPKDECIYDVCVAVSAGDETIEGLNEAILENGKYAVFQVEHTKKAVQHFWQVAMQPDFMKEYLLVLDNKRPVLERYTLKQIDAGFCEFCLPVK